MTMEGIRALSAVISLWLCATTSTLRMDRVAKMSETETIEYVLDHSRPFVPPPGQDGTITVAHSLNINRIIDMDVERQVLTTDAWLQMSWRDERLADVFQQTDPAVQTIAVPNSKVWKPDIVLYNSAAEKQEYSADPLVVVARDGTVFFIPPIRLMTYCKASRDVSIGDSVTCDLKFGSWAYDAGKINVTTTPGYNWQASEFDNTFNHDWEMTSFVTKREEKKYDCCTELYVDVKYTMTLQRK